MILRIFQKKKMDKIKNHNHSTSFFVDQLLNMSLPKLDEKLNKTDLTINQRSTLTNPLSLISNCKSYDHRLQTWNQLNGKLDLFFFIWY